MSVDRPETTEELDRKPVRAGRGRRGQLRSALALAAVWAGLLVWQAVEHSEEVTRHREGLRRAGEAGIGMLEAALRSMGRQRRQRPEYIEYVFREVTAVPGIRGAWIAEPGGEVLAETGSPIELPDPGTFSGAQWRADGLLVGRLAEIGGCPFDGRGRARPSGSASVSTYLFLLLDREAVDREVRAAGVLRIGVQGAATVALAGAWLLLRGRLRTRRLRTELAVAEERARRHREWASLGAGLAHETKNPLAAVRGIAQTLAAEAGTPAAAGRAREIVDEVDRVVSRINEFLQFSRPPEPRTEPVLLGPLFDGLRALLESDLATKRGSLEIEAAAPVAVADPGMLRQVLLNLLVNAARSIPEGGRIRLAARPAPGGGVTIEVDDDGPGIPAEESEKVFEPYYTRSPGGTGLGLAIVRRLAAAHGWRVELETRQAGGARFRISGIDGGEV